MNAVGSDIYNRLNNKWEVIMDDRNMGPGAKFADADLLGIPVRIVVGERNLENGQVELMTSDKSVKKLVNITDIEQEVADLINELKNNM